MDHETTSCCAPSRPGSSGLGSEAPLAGAPGTPPARDVVEIPGGVGLVGTNAPHLPVDCEGPLRQVKLKRFWMDRGAVTNARFAAFVAATGYETEAERLGWSFVFAAHVPASYGPTEGVLEAQWWRRVDGATWRAPNGPGTEGAALPDHPVVQVSWSDARAFAAWAGGRLPTEAEWEHAARGGLGDVTFPWGNVAPTDDGPEYPCNIWQGSFPYVNTRADGHDATAPALSYAPNGYGLYNMVGNAWEWTSEPYRLRSMKREAKLREKAMRGYKLLKGGSFLCHASYCFRYRIAARSGNSPDSTTTHQGFRLVYDRAESG
ncbi:MAG: formylglycine-generating enzyme family protein [Pseudomonadota bacterium]